MITRDPQKLLVLIKNKETLTKRLNTILDRAKKENSPDVFALNKELKKQMLLGKQLVELYNNYVKELTEERKTLVAFAQASEESILRTLRNQVVSYSKQDGGQNEM